MKPLLIVLLIVGAIGCVLRGRFKLRRARELESDPRFRRVAHQIRWVGWFMFLFAGACLLGILQALRVL